MKLKKVSVKNLFGYYCYDINFSKKKSITIIHAPNGYGKTTVLKLIKGILELDFKSIYLVPLDELAIEFEDNTKILVKKEGDFTPRKNRHWSKPIIIEYIVECVGREPVKFEHKFTQHGLEVMREIGVKCYFERNEMQRRRMIEEEKEKESIYKKYCKLEELMKSRGLHPTNINFIDSNRLFISEKKEIDMNNLSLREEVIWRLNRIKSTNEPYFNVLVESINKYAQELQSLILSERQKFANLSEEKERDFPNRLVEYVYGNDEAFSETEIISELNKIDIKRDELEKLGLVLKGKTTTLPQNRNLDQTMLKFYSLYITDTQLKLQAFDDIQPKLELMQDIINNKTRFSNKRMEFDTTKGIIFRPIETNVEEKSIIPLEKLSSGEKHNLILFYELIFKCDRNSIVLIDEPEISLHVAWQMQFVNELSKICEMNGMQAIIATHSPDIVNGNDDLLVSLGEI